MSRLVALVIDGVLLIAATLTVAALPALAWSQVLGTAPPDWLTRGASLVAAVLPWAYFTVSWRLTGQTVGDLLIGIAVRQHDGRAVSLPQAGARALVGLMLAPVWIVGLAAVLWDERRRAWHDLVFHTVVIYTVDDR